MKVQYTGALGPGTRRLARDSAVSLESCAFLGVAQSIKNVKSSTQHQRQTEMWRYTSKRGLVAICIATSTQHTSWRLFQSPSHFPLTRFFFNILCKVLLRSLIGLRWSDVCCTPSCMSIGRSVSTAVPLHLHRFVVRLSALLDGRALLGPVAWCDALACSSWASSFCPPL